MLGKKEIVKMLIENGANVNARDLFDRTPLDLAIIKGWFKFTTTQYRGNE